MKKINKKEEFYCPMCSSVSKKIIEIKDKIQTKTQETKKYAKENPEKTKKVLAVSGAFLVGAMAFLMGRKSKKNKK